MKDPFGRRGQMLSEIVEYDFDNDVGKNVIADALSRLRFDENPNGEALLKTPVLQVTEKPTNESQPESSPRDNDMLCAQKADPVIAVVLQWVAAGERARFEMINCKGH